MATPRSALKARMLTIHPTMAGTERLARLASRWQQAYFYYDGIKLSASNVERVELEDLWILTTTGTVTMWEVYQMLLEEIG